MNTNHSPGPWKVMDGAIQCETINDYGNFIVASCDRERTPQDEANLRLAAAAPDLLSAIKEMLKALDRNNVPTPCYLRGFETQARVALNKAEGTLEKAIEAFLATY